MDHSKNLKSKTLIGIIIGVLSTVIMKCLSLASQVVGGWFLSPEDYGLIALVVVAMSFAGIFQDSGIRKLLVHQYNKWHDIIHVCLKITIISAVLGLVTANLIGWGLGYAKSEGQLLWLVLITAFSIPLIGLSNLYRSYLQLNLKFKEQSAIDIAGTLINTIVFTIAAIFGSGAYSYSLAVFSNSLLVLILSYFFSGKVSLKGKNSVDDLSSAKSVFADLKWLTISTFLKSFVLRVDYLILGLFLTSSELGFYYFGYMLTANIGILFSQTLQNVLTPSISKVINEPERLVRVLNQIQFGIFFICSVACLGLVYFINDIIHFIWGNKWEGAVFTALMMAISLPIRMLVPVSHAVLEAKGLWVLQSKMSALDIIILVVFATAGAVLNGIEGGIIAVALYRIITGILFIFIVTNNVTEKNNNLIISVIGWSIPFVVAVAFGQFVGIMDVTNTDLSLLDKNIFVRIMLAAAGGIIMFSLTFVMHKKHILGMIDMAKIVLKK